MSARNGHTEYVKLPIPHSGCKADNSATLRYSAEDGNIECVKLLFIDDILKQNKYVMYQKILIHSFKLLTIIY